MDIYVRFLGIPKIYINNEWININKYKLNLITLYILYNENCTRDELASIFWPDSDEGRSKSNLRNALYQIKKIFGEEFLEIDGHSFVRISKTINLKKDIDIFLARDKGKNILELDGLIFMDKMYLRDNEIFNEWIDGVRRAYENTILNILNIELNNSVSARNIELIEKYVNKIIGLSPYNEKAHREKIKVHILNHDYNEGIRIYKELENLVEKELGVPLEEETMELYDYMVSKKNNKNESQIKEYFERADLSLIMLKEFNNFLNNKEFKHIIVQGEIGVGKSKLIENFLKNINWTSYTLELKQTITEIDLLGYHKVLDLFNIDGENRTKGFKDFVQKMTKEDDKIILYVKNMEYIDRKSLDYITELLLENKQESIFIIMEISDSIIKDFAINKRLKQIDNLISIKVPLLSVHETIDYVKFKSKNNEHIAGDRDNIYEKSYGNIMFIDELLNPKKNTKDIVEILINSFNEFELDILKKCSIFEEDFTMEDLNVLVDVHKLELLNTIDYLFNKGVFIEKDNRIQIKYKALKSMIYDNLSAIYRTELHGIIADYYEEKEKLSYEDFILLGYHYGRAGKTFEEYYYRLKSLEIGLDYYDQLFPAINGLGDKTKNSYMDRESYYEELGILKKEIEDVKYSLEGESYYKLIMLLEFLIGRTMISGGKREKGILHIDRLISMAKKSKNIEYLLKGYIEYIHYGIHKGSNEIMKEYLNLASGLVREEGFYIENAEITRLKGLYNLRTNNLTEAEELLKESIILYDLPRLSNKNIFPIAAANNYLGHLYKVKREYTTAEKYFLKAIEMCIKYDAMKSLDIFYADYGYMLFVMGNYKKSEDILLKAIEVYEALGTHWKRALVEISLGNIALSKRDFKSALSYLRKAEIFIKKDEKSEELILLNKFKDDLNKKKGGKILSN